MNGLHAAGIIFAILATQASNEAARIGYGLGAISCGIVGLILWAMER